MQHEQPQDPQRRAYSRIAFSAGAQLSIGGTTASCDLRDLSLKGALVKAVGMSPPAPGQPCELELRLDDGGTVIRMTGEVAHAENERIGIVCREIDLDSITSLRRLLELNLGDSELLHRELSALLAT